jgi:hypothetical protein
MGLADLHIHTIYSYDGSALVPAILKRARQVGLDVIAITDHDEIIGSLRALDLASSCDIEVIPGIEVTTAEGDLLALNVTEKIQRGLALIDTVLKVGELGGFCIAPHPMAGGPGMKSLRADSISMALRRPDVSRILVGSKPLMLPRWIERAATSTLSFWRNSWASPRPEAATPMWWGQSGFARQDSKPIQQEICSKHWARKKH